MSKDRSIAVIGSGFGGLSAAIRLQARGFNVSLFEKGPAIGGHAAQLQRDGYTFDMGPSLITAPFILERLFRAAGRELSDYLELLPLDPFYRIYFHNGSSLDYTGDADAMRRRIGELAPRDAEHYDRFMADTRRIYDAVITDGLGSAPFDSLGTMADFIPQALRLKAFTPAYKFVQRYFDDPRIRFTFSFHPLFIGGSPFRAPSVYLMIPYLEKSGGVWFTRGGMYSVVEALGRLFRELGGEIHVNAEVNEIVVENGRAVGLESAAGPWRGDAVVSNADVAHTYGRLLAPRHRRKWNDRKLNNVKYSMSCFLMYIGVRKQYPELLHHTLILSERYRELVADIFDRKVLPDDFSMYLHVPTRTDPGMAPPGCESMYVLIPVANLQADIDWSVRGPRFADAVLEYLENDFGMQGLRENIEVLETYGPEDFARERNSWFGSPWGIEPRLTQTAWFRPHNRSEDVRNLYFVGAGTHPGAGVPGVMLSAEVTEKVVLADLGQPAVAGEVKT